MSYQMIIDGAAAISIDKNPIVSQTITRDQTVRQTSRGGAIYRFTVSANPAMRWVDYRSLVTSLEEGRIGTQTIRINKPAHSWITGYTGDLSVPQVDALRFQYTSAQQTTNPRQVSISSLPAVDANTVLFRAGDLIQSAVSVFPYNVTSTVLRGTGSSVQVPIHRVCLDTASNTTHDLLVGQQVTWRVAMTRMPKWTITGDRLIEWDGDFEFMESLI